MVSHREPEPPHGALAFFGGRQVTRWRHIERGGWLWDGRRVTQTLTNSIFPSWCLDAILNMSPCWCVNEVTVWGMAKEGLQDIRSLLGISIYLHPPSIHWSYYDHGLFCVECEKTKENKKNTYFYNVLVVTQQSYNVQICKHLILFVVSSFLSSRFYHTKQFVPSNI